MNARLDEVKDKIRKLLALAADDSEADGEIVAAMQLAQAAMDKYHLTAADLEVAVEADGAGVHVEVNFGQTTSCTRGVALTNWERILVNAIEKLVGSVKVYVTRVTNGVGTFKKPARRCGIVWYGVEEDTALADELFGMWQDVISTLAMGRYGAVARGAGAQYAEGFATALWTRAQKVAQDRKTVVTPSTTAIVKHGGGSLSELLSLRCQQAETWLAKEQGIKLRKRSSSRFGSSRVTSEGWDARMQGTADGNKAEFSAARRAKLGS